MKAWDGSYNYITFTCTKNCAITVTCVVHVMFACVLVGLGRTMHCYGSCKISLDFTPVRWNDPISEVRALVEVVQERLYAR